MFDENQKAAIERAVGGDRDVIVTGGAGTGKTTIIKEMADRMPGVEIMAPTGKAASRLKEATGHDACTIHRALVWDGKDIHRRRDFGKVIVDEASMIDSWLMAKILDFRPAKLVLVGDSAQLPPVGKGQPFHDLIRLRPDLVVELRRCYRASGAVHKAAQEIRAGRLPLREEISGGETWRVIRTGDHVKTLGKLGEWIKAGHFDASQDVILCCRYGTGEDDGGIKAINKSVKELLNASEGAFSPGDRVIVGKNFSDEDLWNGDLGVIDDIDSDGSFWLRLDRDAENSRLLSKEACKEVALAYCLSVHKSQGSQFRRVFFLVFERHFMMLNRALIYTAVTRAREGVCVCGEVRAFDEGIGRVAEKLTVLQEMGKTI